MQRLDSGSPPRPRRRRKMPGEMRLHDESVKTFSQNLPASNTRSKNKLQKCTASSRKQKTLPAVQQQNRDRHGGLNPRDPFPHHRDVLADPRRPTRRLSATLVPPPFSPRRPSTSVTKPTIKASGLDLSQHRTLIYNRAPTSTPTGKKSDCEGTISIRPGSAPLSTPLVVECETLGRAEGVGQWWRGTLGWEGLRLGKLDGKGVVVPSSLNLKPDGLGPGVKGGTGNACMFPCCQRRVPGRMVARSPGMAQRSEEAYHLSPGWEVHSVSFPAGPGSFARFERPAGRWDRDPEKVIREASRAKG